MYKYSRDVQCELSVSCFSWSHVYNLDFIFLYSQRGRGGLRNAPGRGRGGGRGWGRGRGRGGRGSNRGADKSAEDLDKELDSYHANADAMQT